MPLPHLLPAHAHAIDQQFQVILRMGDRIAATERCVRIRIARAAELVPHRVRHRQVEIRQDNRALRQFADRAQQSGKRGCGAGDACRNIWRGRRIFPHALRRFAKQQVAPSRCIEFTPPLQIVQPQTLDGCEMPQILAPVIGQVAHKIDHAVRQQVLRRDFLHQQAVHHLPGFESEAQQRAAFGSVRAPFLPDQLGKPQPAPRGIGGRRYGCAGTKRIEQRSQRFVQIEIADHDHARHQQARRARFPCMANESLGQSPRGTGAGQQERQPCETEILLRIARYQTRHERIGKAAMCGDRIDLRIGPLRHPAAWLRSA